MKDAFLGVDIGSISTKGVIIDEDENILAKSYIWTEGDPLGATKRLLKNLEKDFDEDSYRVLGCGTTGSARRLVGSALSATVVKNEITAHAIGTSSIHPDVRTILEIGGQDSKIILMEDGIAVDYAMNTLCAAGTGAFLSSQAQRLGIPVEEMGALALQSENPSPIAARCTVFAESDLVHKLQVGHSKSDIIAGLCQAVAGNYLNNVAKGKKIREPIVFQGGVSKNQGVVKAFNDSLHTQVIVDENGHLMGALGVAILAKKTDARRQFNFNIQDISFKTREVTCGKCPNNCEIICVYRDDLLIDSWGNRCERGEISLKEKASSLA